MAPCGAGDAEVPARPARTRASWRRDSSSLYHRPVSVGDRTLLLGPNPPSATSRYRRRSRVGMGHPMMASSSATASAGAGGRQFALLREGPNAVDGFVLAHRLIIEAATSPCPLGDPGGRPATGPLQGPVDSYHPTVSAGHRRVRSYPPAAVPTGLRCGRRTRPWPPSSFAVAGLSRSRRTRPWSPASVVVARLVPGRQFSRSGKARSKPPDSVAVRARVDQARPAVHDRVPVRDVVAVLALENRVDRCAALVVAYDH